MGWYMLFAYMHVCSLCVQWLAIRELGDLLQSFKCQGKSRCALHQWTSSEHDSNNTRVHLVCVCVVGGVRVLGGIDGKGLI